MVCRRVLSISKLPYIGYLIGMSIVASKTGFPRLSAPARIAGCSRSTAIGYRVCAMLPT
jgi:hypothetical protein